MAGQSGALRAVGGLLPTEPPTLDRRLGGSALVDGLGVRRGERACTPLGGSLHQIQTPAGRIVTNLDNGFRAGQTNSRLEPHPPEPTHATPCQEVQQFIFSERL